MDKRETALTRRSDQGSLGLGNGFIEEVQKEVSSGHLCHSSNSTVAGRQTLRLRAQKGGMDRRGVVKIRQTTTPCRKFDFFPAPLNDQYKLYHSSGPNAIAFVELTKIRPGRGFQGDFLPENRSK